jgi:hypothetical protein
METHFWATKIIIFVKNYFNLAKTVIPLENIRLNPFQTVSFKTQNISEKYRM